MSKVFERSIRITPIWFLLSKPHSLLKVSAASGADSLWNQTDAVKILMPWTYRSPYRKALQNLWYMWRKMLTGLIVLRRSPSLLEIGDISAIFNSSGNSPFSRQLIIVVNSSRYIFTLSFRNFAGVSTF